MLKQTVLSASLAVAIATGVHADDSPSTAADDVLELAIRSVPDQEAWKEAAEPFVALLANEAGIIASAEYMSIMGFAPVDANGQPVPNVFIGMLQLDNQAVFDGLMAKFMGANAPAAMTEYLATINNIADILVKPFRDTPALDVANMVKPGQVLEIAVRDVSGWDFNDFDAKRKAFVDVLVAQPGVLGEFEYQSADAKYYVGMTLYENGETLQAIAASPAVTQGPEYGALMQSYPPMVAQYTVRIQ
jgi:hypothetical protein